ncbi:MAG: ABC transporter substrate-binding protein [Xanthobacteraceae bacterium]|nr:ABC transporter substrate-binding protein [Xanthobacteraceae bacterium]QYK45686.1 MAG: ABC transporter substrate-binding protein [Xanthobacteraceae bacterium]
MPTTLLQRAVRIGFAALLSVSASSLAANAQEKIVVGQATATSLTFGPVFAAIELGFFKEEGLELDFKNFSGASVLIPQIANKSVTIGFPGPDPLILSRQPGRDPLPVQFFYNAARQSIWQFLVLEDSPIKTLSDMRGKKIGVGALANANVPITRAMLAELGMTMTKDYSFLAVGVGAPAFRATQNKDVDVYNTFDTNIAAFENTGTKLRRIPQDQKYLDLFSNGFAAHIDTIKDKPQIVIGFGRAFTKGIIVCEVNPDFCVKNFYKYNPTLRPQGVSDEDALKLGRHVLASRMSSYLAFPKGEKRTFGVYSEKSWKEFVKALHTGGELSTDNIDVSTLYTNKFAPEYIRFDEAKLRKQAESLK